MKPYTQYLLLAGVAALQFGCSTTRIAPPAGQPAANPAELVADLRSATLPTTPVQVNFSWTLEERGSRVGGRGVVRVEAPERIRLDLFGARGETYLVAALVDAEYHLPPAVTPPVALPSPALLWAALGVFSPPAGASLTNATTGGGGADIRYSTGGGELYLYTFEGLDTGVVRLARVERAGSRGVLESVTLQRSSENLLGTTRYRDWSNFRDLNLQIETTRETGPFPQNIWRPDAELR